MKPVLQFVGCEVRGPSPGLDGWWLLAHYGKEGAVMYDGGNDICYGPFAMQGEIIEMLRWVAGTRRPQTIKGR